MDQLQDMREAVQSDLTVGDESSLYPSGTIDLAINRAYRKIGAMFKWNETKDALKTNTIPGNEYYDYPDNWRSNSIWKLTVDGIDYGDPLTFKDYNYEKENNFPAGFTKIWANMGKKYFITPVPTTGGTNNIAIFGFQFIETLQLDGDITIFSYSMPEINEAIVLEAVAILKNKGGVQTSASTSSIVGATLLSAEAKNIVLSTWSKISMEESKLVRTTQQFDVPDFFADARTTRLATRRNIGNF